MRVVCDNCGASYKIPDSKLTKEVNKATCRKCGHAIFIRRETLAPAPPPQPTPGEERTLITSAADLERAVRERSISTFDAPEDMRPTQVSLDTSGGEATVPREPAPVSLPPSRAPSLPPAESPRVERSRTNGAGPALPISPPSLPPVASPVAAARAGHDPRSDLLLALLGTLVTMLGLFVLVVANWVGQLWALGGGLFLALLGTFVVFLVLLTGARGTRPASWIAALAGSFMLSLATSAVAVLALYAVAPDEPDVVALGTVTPPVAVPPPKVDPLAQLAEPVAPVAPPVVEPPPPPVVEPPPPPVVAASTPKATPPPVTRTPTPTRVAEEAPTRIPTSRTPTTTKTASLPEPEEEEPTPAPKASTGISPVVIDTMIKSNKNVKSCFVQEKAESGALPRNVKAKITIQPTGKVSAASIPSGDYQGTPFDSCLSGALKGITFPPYDGSPLTVTYPFVL